MSHEDALLTAVGIWQLALGIYVGRAWERSRERSRRRMLDRANKRLAEQNAKNLAA